MSFLDALNVRVDPAAANARHMPLARAGKSRELKVVVAPRPGLAERTTTVRMQAFMHCIQASLAMSET